MNKREPYPGEIIKAYVPSKMVWHYGIYAGNDYVIDMAPRRGIAKRHWTQFSEGGEVLIEPNVQGDLPNDVVLKRAESLIGRANYSILFHNCEQFINNCRRGKLKSEQLSNTTYSVLGVVAGVYVLSEIIAHFGSEK